MRTCDAINMSTTKDPAAGIVYGEIWTRVSPTGKIDVMIKNTWHRLTRAEAIELKEKLIKTLELDNEVCRACEHNDRRGE